MCTYWKKLKRSSTKKNKKIDSIGIGLASPEEIRRWGERKLPNGTVVGKVDKDHTVDYESLKPIEGGLFCERIFGPVEDFYCSCERRGEKGEQFCSECEVEFTKSRVRRTRMGYIPLAVPVAHVWYLRGRPSYIANLIGKSRSTVDKVAYGETLCESFIGNTLQSTTLTTAEKCFFYSNNSPFLSLPSPLSAPLTKSSLRFFGVIPHEGAASHALRGSAGSTSDVSSNSHKGHAKQPFSMPTPLTSLTEKNMEHGPLTTSVEKELPQVANSKQNELPRSQAILNQKAAQGKERDKINLTFPVHFKNSGLHLLSYPSTAANHQPHSHSRMGLMIRRIKESQQIPELAINVNKYGADAIDATWLRTNAISPTDPPCASLLSSPMKGLLRMPVELITLDCKPLPHHWVCKLRAADRINYTKSLPAANKGTVEGNLFTNSTNHPLEKKRVHLDFLGITERRYHKLHTLPVFSTFTYKEWSDRFAFLDYLIGPSKRYDLPVPFYTRVGTPHIARRYSVNLVKNKFALEKTPKHWHDAINANECEANVIGLHSNAYAKTPISAIPLSYGVHQCFTDFLRAKHNWYTLSSGITNGTPHTYPMHARNRRGDWKVTSGKLQEKSVENGDKGIEYANYMVFANATPLLRSFHVLRQSSQRAVDRNKIGRGAESEPLFPNSSMVCIPNASTSLLGPAEGSTGESAEKVDRSQHFALGGKYPLAFITTPSSDDHSKNRNEEKQVTHSKQMSDLVNNSVVLVNNTSNSLPPFPFVESISCTGANFLHGQTPLQGKVDQLPTQSSGEVTDTQQFPRLSELLHFTGGTALRHLLARFHFVLLGRFLRHELKTLELKINHLLALKMLTYSQGLLLGKLAKRRSKQIRRLKLIELFQSQKSNPEWMILSVLPVLPPDLRPILRVNDDFVVASDLNRLYQTVVRRNNTIQERLDDPLPCPESGLFRQRSLQKAVDGLLENGKGGGTPLCAAKRRPLVSLSHILKGKKGLFRQHLLGKRVDYSGRSVIVVGPKLNLHECGLPKEMAMELFQPFLIHRLKIQGLATSNTAARQMIQQEDPAIWQTVKQLIYEHPVLLNRAPTLHRLGIQAFQPRLVSGRAILLHPLVCNGFNADFDGDQMAVHIPLSFQARAEAWKIMWSKNNLLSPATGHPILVPSQDMVLGCYYLSVIVPRVKREQGGPINLSTAGFAPTSHSPNSPAKINTARSNKTLCVRNKCVETGEESKNLSKHSPNVDLPLMSTTSCATSEGGLTDSNTRPIADLLTEKNNEGDITLPDLRQKPAVDRKKIQKLALISSAPLSTPLTTIEGELADPSVSKIVADSLHRVIKKRRRESAKPITLVSLQSSWNMVFANARGAALANTIFQEVCKPTWHVKPAKLESKITNVPMEDICKTTKTQLLNNALLLHNMAVWQGKKINEVSKLLPAVNEGGGLTNRLSSLSTSGGEPISKKILVRSLSTPSGFTPASTREFAIDVVANKVGMDTHKGVLRFPEGRTNSMSSAPLLSTFLQSSERLANSSADMELISTTSCASFTYGVSETRGIADGGAKPDRLTDSKTSIASITPTGELSPNVIDRNRHSMTISPPASEVFSNDTRVSIRKSSYFSSLQDSLVAYFQGKLQTHTPLWVRLGTNENFTETIIESNDNLETPLELRLGADGNLVKVLPTFQNHYRGDATMLDQCQEKSIKYIRTTAGRIVINNALFPSV